VDAVPPVAARRAGEARLPAGLLHRTRLMATVPEGQELFLVRVVRGGPWDWSKDMREQELWTEHAQFMNGLVDDGLILLGGPVEGGREAFHVVDASSEEALRARFAEDPWAKNGMLTVTGVERWTILLSPED
jgi:uncharacterized protein YciI